MTHRSLILAGAALMLSAALPATAVAQTMRAADSSVGTIIIAHGGGPEWNAQVERVAAEVRLAGPVAVSYLMGPGAKAAPFQQVVESLVARGASEIVVVPMLVSSHSGHYQQIRYLVGETDSLSETMQHHLHMGGIERPAGATPLRLTRAMDDAPEVAAVIAERALALAGDPAGRALFIVGHGPNSAEDAAEWMRNLRPIADSVRARTGFRSVLVGLVRDDAPAPVRSEAVQQVREMIALQHELTGQDVIVVPVLVSTGSVSRDKLPADLAGMPVVYKGEPLLPHPGMARWVEARAAGR
jgi:sirohydrochlorin ferrochelatase